jgi:hypothetical protein
MIALEAELIELSKKKLDISDHVNVAVRNLAKVNELFSLLRKIMNRWNAVWAWVWT